MKEVVEVKEAINKVYICSLLTFLTPLTLFYVILNLHL